MDELKTTLITLLRKWVAQRSGIDTRDYVSDWRDTAGVAALRADQRSIAKDGADARALLSYIEGRDWITGEMLASNLRDGQRLSYNPDRQRIEYVTGQYWPTEYRSAVCRCLTWVIWQACRQHGIDDVRRYAKEQFGKGLQERWFN